ncbi:hypothetical protein C0J52_21051 [Blattella germanica]|nr:hypothetical protein C0J52_21051 [Blattella germanica]
MMVGSLKKTTIVVNNLIKNGIREPIECEELHTLRNKKAFKAGFPLEHLENTQDPRPENITPNSNHTIEINDDIGILIKQADNHKPANIAGDLNFRLDDGNYKTKTVIRTLAEERFILLNNRQVPTYICHNWIKHYRHCRNTKRTEIEKVVLEKATEELLKSATIQTNTEKRKSKWWFDSDCYSKRNIVLNTLHRLRRNSQGAKLRRTYTEEMKSYKNYKRKEKIPGKGGKKRSRRSNKRPFHRPTTKKTGQKQNIGMKELEDHFSKILNTERISNPPRKDNHSETKIEKKN